MDTKTLQIERRTARIWGELCELRPGLVRFNEPKIIFNNRFWRTAGCCHQEKNVIELGSKFFSFSRSTRLTMLTVILPHEIIHQADFNLYGLCPEKCGHGENWAKLMVEYGLAANKYHTMEITR